jgi:tetratricopeptide (TPR) repeat protein
MSTLNDIARYAEGDMPADERAAFEAALASDETLQQQLNLYREVHGSLQQHFSANEQRGQLQGTLHSLQGEFFNEASQPGKLVSMKRWLRGAVAVAAVLIAVMFIWQLMQPDLFEKYAAINMDPAVERGEQGGELLQAAVTAFNKKDYASAVQSLAQVRQQDTTNSVVNFYYGVSLLQTNRITQAREIFNQLWIGQSAFKFDAAFYQALTYLKEDNKPLCKEWLLKIPADAPNYNKAQELLEKL